MWSKNNCYFATHACNICWKYQPFWIVSFLLTDKKVGHVLVCSPIFYYFKKKKKKKDQRNCIKFYVINVIKYAKTFGMLIAALVLSMMSWTQFRLWCNQFKAGREEINDNAYAGKPSILTDQENIEAVKKMILHNRWTTIREAADDVGISPGSCQAILQRF